MKNRSNTEFQKKSIKQLISFCAVVVFILIIGTARTNAQYVSASGNKILDKNGNEIFFTGMNLGNWLLWEGYLMMGDFNFRTHTQFFNSVTRAFGNSTTRAKEFEHQWRLNYVTEKAIQDLKNLGFNSVRVPFHYNMFWNGSSVKDDGFQYFDRVIDYCRTHGLYVLLDMHAAPGYQNPGDHSDNVNSNASQPRETVKFWDGNNVSIAATVWKHIANHYKNEPVIWGYDLINEPVPQAGREYELLPSLVTIRNAIRQVDNNHLIVAEGSWWGSDMSKIDWKDSQVQAQTGINSKWDSKLVYQTHHYSTDISLLNERLAITNKLNVPLILGEYGESDMNNLRNMTNWCINNNVGYFPWSFKKMSHDKCLWTIPPNGAYNELKNAINSNSVGPSNLYDNMITFAKNNIKNGHSAITWHQEFYDAVKNNSTPPQTCSNASAKSIPGTIQAEDYCAMNGIRTQNTSDAGGGQNVGWVDAGDWLDYRVNVSSAGSYTVRFRVAADGSDSKSISLRKGSSTLGTANFNATGGWQTWITVSKTVTLSAGVQTLRVYFPVSGLNLNWVEFVSGSTCNPTAITPYYQINSDGWRSSTSATMNVGDKIWFGPQPIGGTWSWTGPNGFTSSRRDPTITNIQSNQAGTYTARYTNSCGAVSTKNFTITVNGSTCNPTAITPYYQINSDGWRSSTSATMNVGDKLWFGPQPIGGTWSWTGPNGFTSSRRDPTITNIQSNQAGTYTARYTNSCGAISAKNFTITVNGGSGFSVTVQAEDYFDNYGAVIGNTSDVGGGQHVGYLDNGDWMGYSINLPASDVYTIEYRIASPNGGARLQLEKYGGSPVYGTIDIPSTGGWQNWTTTSHTVNLTAGQQNIAIYVLNAGLDINWFRITQGDVKSADNIELSSEKYQLYPNPVNETLHVKHLSTNTQIEVYSLSGIKVKENFGTSVDVSELAAGVYFVRVHHENGFDQLKVLKK